MDFLMAMTNHLLHLIRKNDNSSRDLTRMRPPVTRTIPRMKMLSVSKMNEETIDIVDDYNMQWGDQGFSPTVHTIIRKYDSLMKKIMSSKWEIIKQLETP